MARRWAVPALAALALALVVLGGLLVSYVQEGTSRQGARVVHFTIDSAYVQRTMRETAVIPAGSDGQHRPLLVLLHVRGGNEDSSLDGEIFAALHRLGRRAPVVVFPSGDESYWHDRRQGRWAAYVLEEVIPLSEARFGTDTSRVAIGGIAMGGFGAFDLARAGRRFCAVGGHSPALWTRASRAVPGAFDDRADFARHDVVGLARRAPRRLARQPLWLDAGTRDPFRRGDRAFVRALRDAHVPISVRRWPGRHDRSYWRAHWGAYLRFYARALTRCG